MQHYDNPQCVEVEEFNDDLRRIKYIKRLFNQYDMDGVLKERLQAHGFPDGAATLDEEKHKYFPIPVGEVLYNELIDQNPLWN